VRQPSQPRRVEHRVELLTSAFDPDGRARGSRRQTARVVLLPTYGESAEYEVLSRIELKPGRYSLRVAAHNDNLDLSGSVYFDVDVPDFTKDALSASGVAITRTPGGFVAPRDALDDLLPLLPTTARAFDATDEVGGFMRIYQGGRDPLQPVAISLAIVDARGREVHQASATIAAAPFNRDRAADFRFEIPVVDLPPGEYLATVTARMGDTSVRRDVRFERR